MGILPVFKRLEGCLESVKIPNSFLAKGTINHTNLFKSQNYKSPRWQMPAGT